MNKSVKTSSVTKNAGTKEKKRKQTRMSDVYPVTKRQFNRFGGMSEEDVMKLGLPDYLMENLDIVFVGINPGLAAAYAGKYYTGPGNHFWRCLFLSGIIDKELSSNDDSKLLDYKIGFTNMVARTTKGSNDLSKTELKEGGEIMIKKMQKFRPKVVVFNGKISYEIYSGKKKFFFGRQEEVVHGTDTHIWVMPSSSARCAQLPRAEDKVPFFSALSKYVKYLKGEIPDVTNEQQFVFANVQLKGFPKNKK